MGVGRRVSAALVVGGACAVSGQIILLRELLVAFHGHELSLGVILASWLLWGGMGSWLVGSRADRLRRPVLVLAILFALGGILLPATVFASAYIKQVGGASPLETLGLFEFLPRVVGLLAPLCFVMGSVFAIGVHVLDQVTPARNQVSRAYLLENTGAGVGGLAVSLLVLPWLGPLSLAFALGAVLLGIGFLLAGHVASVRWRRIVRLGLGALIVASATAAVHPQPDDLRHRSQWHGFRLLEAGNSLLGSLAAIDMEGEISLYENGLLVATSGYRMHAEELVHLGMVQHPDPKSVLLLGGGVGGALREILKYPIDHCDYVELDPMLLAIARRHVCAQELVPLDDARVTIHHGDGRYFIKNAPRTYDMVVLDLPGPRTAQLNRFYSLEFFREVHQILGEDGVLVFKIASSEAYPAPEQRVLLAALRKTARLAFAQVATLPGDMCYFVLSVKHRPLTDAHAILSRLSAAGIERTYIRETMLPFRLNPWRADQLERALADKETHASPNRDFRPLGYLYDLAQWSAQFKGPLRSWVRRVIVGDPRWLYAVPVAVLAVLVVLTLALRRRTSAASETDPRTPGVVSREQRFAVGAAVAITGLSEIVFQVTALVGFQILYGYLFYRLGIMVAAFMAGLAAGSFWLWRQQNLPPARRRRWFVRVHMVILLYPLLLPLMLRVQLPSGLFMFLPAIAGVLGGLEFPLAVRLWTSAGREVGRAAGVLYALDLFGACLGAAIVSPFLIPLLGLDGICWWSALLNAAVVAMLLLPSSRRQPT